MTRQTDLDKLIAEAEQWVDPERVEGNIPDRLEDALSQLHQSDEFVKRLLSAVRDLRDENAELNRTMNLYYSGQRDVDAINNKLKSENATLKARVEELLDWADKVQNKGRRTFKNWAERNGVVIPPRTEDL